MKQDSSSYKEVITDIGKIFFNCWCLGLNLIEKESHQCHEQNSYTLTEGKCL